MKTILQKGIKVVLVTGAVYGLAELAYLMGNGVMLGVIFSELGISESILEEHWLHRKRSAIDDVRFAVMNTAAKFTMNHKD